MAHLFRAYRARDVGFSAYFIESTAPDNIEDRPTPPPVPPQLVPVDADRAIEDIAAELSGSDAPNLVIMVHGYNNPPPSVFKFYASAAAAIDRDPSITGRKGLVCVGYRWPSENMGAPWPSWRSALPTMATWLGRLGLILLLCGIVLILLRSIWHLAAWLDPSLHQTAASLAIRPWIKCALSVFGHVVALLGLLVAGLIGCAILLRIIVYFRDGYRATNYGAPDLVEIVRQIDRHIFDEDHKHHRANRDAKRVQLSFIGHSMGGFVVTNAIRVLSDVFDFGAMRPRLNAGTINEENAARFSADESAPDLSPHIGHAFSLMRFVLASPDIPAEALISNRANFLSSSLRRFREAYLFSNEGDEVLRQISTVANYFSFPTKSWKFGFRLGNVEILSSGYGVIPVARHAILKSLRIGFYTLQEIYDRLCTVRGQGTNFDTLQNKLPERFSYFDCTDYVDTDNDGVRRPLLTFALRLKRNNPQARMSWRQHLCLLESYVWNRKPDVHAGYFQGLLSQQLIYRLACLGHAGTIAAYGGRPQLSDACREKQIRVLMSPGL
jgi:Putative serine esterase (DUF676)